MKHYIISKFNKDIDRNKLPLMLEDIKAIFNKTLDIEGIYNVEYKLNCINRDNRYDLMIVIEMDKEALEAYDNCAAHHEWKDKYGSLLEKKAIFDCED